ncbi:actin-like protein, putative [Plasmodium knowlesi strain H]|uniref:Actin-like protein, putative n=3 Tax=Plasmodium knowlesi TaxID=5850 RepID=A0A5K1V928_PLAKH|nr:actin-like protein, putative [Plasmodium knowlesi strain H]OTN67079.1 putative Actin-like protein [Plasmodium knowlesi]CAA9988788.1 actin-like protein, putative [Plasmodium knowlesi strain H]SBO21749.1 actin-like protein, putative [Plasmodium knowlesi strain H]SBO22140.1 actin-like protein, putative [Plasmodium knowlesi strain H]VVS78262.1 actin-like protein, putative [Plasmodium knowlesi strain H]|eukprot:XP_002259765.1 actin-related protein, putative [Plasmodium knowlesi strain H]
MDSYNDILSIVVDLGFENTKIGYAGDENPTNIFSTNVGVPLDLEAKIKNEIYKKCLCTKEEFYQFNLIYPLCYLHALENVKVKPCLYLDSKNHFDVNEDVFEKILFMNVNGGRCVNKLLQRRVKAFIGNKLHKQSDISSEFVDEGNVVDGVMGEETHEGNAIDSESGGGLPNGGEEDEQKSHQLVQSQKQGGEDTEEGITEEEEVKSKEMETLKKWAEENNYFDIDLIENKLIDVNGIRNMINNNNSVACGLNEKIENFPYLFSLPNKRNQQIKAKISELLFEKYKVPALYFNSKSVLTGFAYNKNICSVVDVGSSYTDFSLCNEGNIDDKNYKIYNIGGSTVDYFLEDLLEKHNKEYCIPYYEVYKKNGKVQNYNKDKVHLDYYNKAKYIPLKDLKSYLCEVAHKENEINDAKNMNFNENMNVYILPDGQNINITKFNNIACEIFFTPSLLSNTKLDHHRNNLFLKEEQFEGVSTTLFNMLNRDNLKQKEELLQNVILTGSSTLFDNFNQRFIKEFNQLDIMNNSNLRNFHVLSHGKYDKQYSSWKGGSILSSFKNFNSFFVTRKEYEEFGLDIVNRKC